VDWNYSEERSSLTIFNNRRSFNFIFVICYLIFISSCSARGANEGETFEKTEITIQSGNNIHKLTVELAITEAQRAQGLMHRTSLNDGYGMLFIFERDQILSFWMKDTLIPLSIAYIAADGRILEIHNMEPRNLTPVISSRSVRYALEVPQNWFTRMGINPGDRVNVDLF